MPSKFKLNSSPPSRGRREIQGSPSFLRKSSEKENTGTVTDQRPCFYKIICDEEPEPKKKFPRQFLKYISKEISDTATLRVVSGGLWTVKVKIIGNDVFMEDGWPEFFRGNSLRIKDFLFFQYDGKMFFSVTIFYPNGVERIGTSSIRMPQESAGISTGKRPRGRPRKNPVDTLNRQYTSSNSYDESLSTDQGLASHKSKKLKTAHKGENVNDKSQSLKTTQKGKNVNYNSKELQTKEKEKGKNVKAPFRDRIESSNKQPKRTTMEPSLEKKPSKKSHLIIID
ncbi:B3 domain-containing protein Os11g0197600-like [Pistacia vera]|uniref:B3 domain-containing protein Os11g0197600-like n=1 Tax=Pistacia vera TaxID=55513 RepID=UPI001262ED6C|nr:B3 domain-containing protein Os11g0197600-like [Pistacia vera]